MRRSSMGIMVLALLCASACDSGKSKASNDDEKAGPPDAKADGEDADAVAKRKAEREAAQAAEDQAATERAETIQALAVIPESLPADLEKACDGMLEAYDGFMRKTLQGDMLTKWETGGNEMQLAVFRKACLERDIATAACQTHALNQAPPELEPQLSAIMTACADKAAAATAKPAQ